MKPCSLIRSRPVITAILVAIGTASGAAPATNRDAAASGVSLKTAEARKPNRTVPKVSPPKTGLEFSAHPTAQEISQARVFEELLVPIGGEPSAQENTALANALLAYAKRSTPDEFTSLSVFLEKHPKSAWRVALLTCLGLEYYNTAHYSRALEVWQEAWMLGEQATQLRGKLVADRAACELAALYSRLGRTTELEVLLKSVENRMFIGGASERINIAREVLTNMKHRPEVSFRCGPLALQSIKRSIDPEAPVELEIFNSASTPNGFSLPQVAELSTKVGLSYQMAFRQERGEFVVPSVVHWKVGHYAAIVRKDGDRYLLEDPTFATRVWATRPTLEAETSGYFLIPPGELPQGWRRVDSQEGGIVWGKGTPGLSDGDIYGWNDLQTGSCGMDSAGMAVSSVHLMLVNLQVRDTPVGYSPPVGPPVRFTVRYNQRDYLSGFDTLFGPKWSHDWAAYIRDSPQSPLSDVKYIVGGGGARTFTAFNNNTRTFAPNQYDHTVLERTGPNSYEMTWPDGSKMLFGQSDGSVGSVRRIFLTGVSDASGNTVTLGWERLEFVNAVEYRLLTITDAIGQVTGFSYGIPLHPFLITRVQDPFGRSAQFNYTEQEVGLVSGSSTNFLKLQMLTGIRDVLGLVSQFRYRQIGFNPQTLAPIVSDQIESMTTPYGTTRFVTGSGTNTNFTTFRFVETHYPDGTSDRVEFNQSDALGIPSSDPAASIPVGMEAQNQFLHGRNTYYWSRTAEASSRGDHTKAKIFHWLHTADFSSVAGILSSVKEPLEGRVWYDYQGGGSSVVRSSDKPTRIGRVLDDGQTQLYTMAYNSFGLLTNSIDPLGRTFGMTYASNGIDLLEVRQTRAANNELLFRATYNAQHRPLTVVDAAGQTNAFTYDARGQLVRSTNAKGEITTYAYTADGYLLRADGPLPGTNDVVNVAYDALGRVRTMIGLSGYTLTFDYDAMDRVTKITHPDGTFEQFTYDRLDLSVVQDRAGRQTIFDYDAIGQIKKQTDPLGRVTRFDWCRCGQIKSLTDPMGQTTTWLTDIQGRPTAKRYADGSQITYLYENTSSRLRLAIDEKQQVTQFAWNRDDTLQSLSYGSAPIATPGVRYQYDPDYERVVSMIDGTGTTRYSYNPVTGTPTLGAGGLASVDGPLPNDTITYSYDELNRPAHRAINGVGVKVVFDDAGRVFGITNALGAFAYGYDGSTIRLVSTSLPNGQTEERSYGDNVQDRTLQRITHQQGATPISEFLYGHDVTRGRIATWSQQVGAQSPNRFTVGYDAVNQLLSTTVTNAGTRINAFAYTYDPSGNRLSEQIGASNYVATYNGLNEIRSTTAPGITRTNEWDAQNRLTAVNVGNQRTEFTYDGLDRRVAIRQLVNGSEVSFRRFVWCDEEICEERDADGAVTKRFFPNGVKVENGPAAGSYFYTRDHLGSIRELVDSSGNVRARYSYDPFGRRTRLSGDVGADFGFAGMFWSPEANLALTYFRAYDPELGRWLSRDPLPSVELIEGPNLYAYVVNDPINRTDPLGLITTLKGCFKNAQMMAVCTTGATAAQQVAEKGAPLVRTSPGWAPAANRTLQCAEPIFAEAEAAIPAIIRSPGVERVLNSIQTSGGGRVLARGVTQFADTMVSSRTAYVSQRYEQAQEWIHATLAATDRYRYMLPPEKAIDAYRLIVETARTLFGITGPFTPY